MVLLVLTSRGNTLDLGYSDVLAGAHVNARVHVKVSPSMFMLLPARSGPSWTPWTRAADTNRGGGVCEQRRGRAAAVAVIRLTMSLLTKGSDGGRHRPEDAFVSIFPCCRALNNLS